MTDTAHRTPDAGPAPRRTILTACAIAVGVVAVMGLLLGLIARTASPTTPAAPASSAPAAPAPATPGAAAPSTAPAPVLPAPSATPAPSAAPAPSATPAPPGNPASRQHQVVSGDTLSGIALRYGVPLETIAVDNGLSDHGRIRAGQALTVGAAPPGVVVIAPGSTLGGIAHDHATTVSALRALNPQITDPDRIVAGAGLRLARA